jgi:lysyl-tRNA synthetase class I
MGGCCCSFDEDDMKEFNRAMMKTLGVKSKMLSSENGRVDNRIKAAPTWMLASKNGRKTLMLSYENGRVVEEETFAYIPCSKCNQRMWMDRSKPVCVRCDENHMAPVGELSEKTLEMFKKRD